MHDRLRGPRPVPDLHHRLPAVATRLPPLRQALTDWAHHAGLSAERIDAITLATTEAMANVVRHAYDTIGILDLHATNTGRQVTVTVTDYGHWKSPRQPRDRFAGRGVLLIHALTDHARITTTAEGTTVRMTWRHHPQHQPGGSPW